MKEILVIGGTGAQGLPVVKGTQKTTSLSILLAMLIKVQPSRQAKSSRPGF
jgi:hypothetical protein